MSWSSTNVNYDRILPFQENYLVDMDEIPLSKNKLKKIKRNEEWEANRANRKLKRKEKKLEKKQRVRAAQESSANNGPGLPASTPSKSNVHDGKEPKCRRYRDSVQLPVTIILDCGFDDLMMEKEITSLASQLTRCYSDNHKAPYKVHLGISSFGGHLKGRFDTVLSGNYLGWKDVRFIEEDFIEAAKQAKEWMKGSEGGVLAGALTPKEELGQPLTTDQAGAEEIVYLTSESPDTLTELKPYSTYIVGGLVDRNRHKGICFKRAMDRGFKTAKLPIGDYMQMATRFVLATNHVSEIMIRWLELGDWGEAFSTVMPKRKGGILKSKLGETEAELEPIVRNNGKGGMDVEVDAEDGEEEEGKREDHGGVAQNASRHSRNEPENT